MIYATKELPRSERIPRCRPRARSFRTDDHALTGLLMRIAITTLVCLFCLTGCSNPPEQVGVPVVAPRARFGATGWSEPSNRLLSAHKGDVGQILFRMKKSNPNRGALLSIRGEYSHADARTHGKEVVRWRTSGNYSAWENLAPIKGNRSIGGRRAFGYSYREKRFKRWTQVWFVNCGDYVCEVYLESPSNASCLDSSLFKALDSIRWNQITIYK